MNEEKIREIVRGYLAKGDCLTPSDEREFVKDLFEAMRTDFKKDELDRRELSLLDREKALIVREKELRLAIADVENFLRERFKTVRDDPIRWVRGERQMGAFTVEQSRKMFDLLNKLWDDGKGSCDIGELLDEIEEGEKDG